MQGSACHSRLAWGLVVTLGVALGAPRPAPAETRDPLLPMLHRMNDFFHRHEVDGVTLDSRYAILPTEVARLSAVSQILGYAELYRACPIESFRQDIAQRADFLLARIDEVTSRSAFDGMLGYSLLEAYDVTGDPRYLAEGTTVVERLEALPPSETILNGGLMAALALAKYHVLTDDPTSEQRTRDILASLPLYQNADGCFPHWCRGSKDVHYTGWMAMELILIERMLDDPLIAPMLERMHAFMEGRVDDTGNTRYQEPCDAYPGCVVYYYSYASGCGIDYDTRAFTNELGYTAMLFDRFQSPKYWTVMRFFRSLEHHGVFADKWDYWPPPSDPYYVWTASDTSVVNMSVIFWSLASIFSGRRALAPNAYTWADEGERGADVFLEGAGPISSSPRPSPVGVPAVPVAPNPTRDACAMRFSMPAAAFVSLDVYDAGGRRVHGPISQRLEAGDHSLGWDGRDDAGGRCPSGLYWLRLRVADRVHSASVLILR